MNINYFYSGILNSLEAEGDNLPLHAAAFRGDAEEVERILREQPEQALKVTQIRENTALMCAIVGKCDRECVMHLVELDGEYRQTGKKDAYGNMTTHYYIALKMDKRADWSHITEKLLRDDKICGEGYGDKLEDLQAVAMSQKPLLRLGSIASTARLVHAC